MSPLLLAGKRIFIIEDNLANRAIMQLLLEQNGAEIWFERWGLDAIGRLKQFMPVHLVLLDLMFPGGVTGYDVFDRIKADIELQHIPVVAVSAGEPSVAIPKTREKGFSGFIAKPISFEKFPRQIAQVLDNEQVWVE
jgi:CheY-like chemotaxis protein